MTRQLICLVLAAALTVLATSSVRAEEDREDVLFRKDTPVEIAADTLDYDKKNEIYTAKGNVVITQDQTTLEAEEAVLNTATGVAIARGEVRIVDEGGNTLNGVDLQLNLKDKTMILSSGRIFYQLDNVYIGGSPIRKTGPQSYDARDATYTTCDCPEDESPPWNIYAQRARVTVGEFMVARNAYFYIKGVPVLYSPYIRVPVKRPRQSGFLQPKPGYSKLRGFKFDNSFFWAISPQKDATFYLDIETARGYGAGAEYRYYRTRKSYGEAYAYYYREKDIDRVRRFRDNVGNLARPLSAGEDRWQVDLMHTEDLGGSLILKANVQLVSDDEFFIDLGSDGDRRTLESLESNISLSKSWKNYSLVAQLRLFDNLLSEKDLDTLQKLPEVTFTGTEQRIPGSNMYFSLESSYINFRRKAGVDGHRLDVRPRISLPFNLGGYVEVKPSVAPRATLYMLDGSVADRFIERLLYDAQVDVTTTFNRVYTTGSSVVPAFKHTIRPKLNYTYVPESIQAGNPDFDAVDRMDAMNTITYSLNSMITGKVVKDEAARYHDYLYLEVKQGYNFREASRSLTSATDKRRPFSDLSGEVIIRPTELVTLSARGSYDVYDTMFENYDTSVEASDERGDELNLTYRYVLDGESYFEATARAHLTKPLDLTYIKRFSVDDHRSLETSYGVEYSSQCWGAILTYTERLEENIVFLSFKLLGLGRIAGAQAKIEPL